MPWIYDGKEREETVEWTEKDLHTEIEVQLLRCLKSRGLRPSDVKAVQAVVGGDHGDTAQLRCMMVEKSTSRSLQSN